MYDRNAYHISNNCALFRLCGSISYQIIKYHFQRVRYITVKFTHLSVTVVLLAIFVAYTRTVKNAVPTPVTSEAPNTGNTSTSLEQGKYYYIFILNLLSC